MLAVDTTSTSGSIALARGGSVVAVLGASSEAQRASLLWTDIALLLDRVGAAIGDVDAFAVARGPGAFTGLRVGIAACAGLARATGRPLYGATTLELAALEAGAGDTVWVILNAYRNEVYAQSFRVEARGGVIPLTEPLVDAPQAIISRIGRGPAVVAGSGALRYADALHVAAAEAGVGVTFAAVPAAASAGWTVAPTAAFLAPALARRASASLAAHETPAPVEPCYVRRSEAEINLELGKLQPAGVTRVG